MVMNSRHCINTEQNVTKLLGNYTPKGDFKFSTTFWQPFVDIDVNHTEKTAKVCGPILGILLEFVKKEKMR